MGAQQTGRMLSIKKTGQGNVMKIMHTSEIAKAAGVHPNTIRMYEQWGLLPVVPRSPTGYRLFTQEHLDQVKLIRLMMRCTMFGKGIRKNAYQVLHLSAEGCFSEALQCARALRDMIETECHQAEEAENFLEQWALRKATGSRRMKSDRPESKPAIQGNEKLTDGDSEAKGFQLSHGETVGFKTAAKLLSITPDTLRDWERNNLIHIPRNPLNGYRQYGIEEINKLRVIRVLRRSNYSNMAILRAISKLESGSAEGLREALDCPELDEDRGYLCFTDTLLTALYTARDAIDEIILHLSKKITV